MSEHDTSDESTTVAYMERRCGKSLLSFLSRNGTGEGPETSFKGWKGAVGGGKGDQFLFLSNTPHFLIVHGPLKTRHRPELLANHEVTSLVIVLWVAPH
ncbi:hypothetical protein J6590_039729 [Homalodisca vitripennis]|nr:hypothetical protein J6590_039729 [Homalodisca vitripennis]